MKPQQDELLNHEADGIREFDNALPRWWLYGFYLTIVFAIAYYVNFHVLTTPLVGEAGVLAEYQSELAAAERQGAARGRGGRSAVTLLTDAASLAQGKAIFEGPTNLCATCHRPDLGGLVGPNLTDDLWMHGCDPSEVAKSITTGFPIKGMLPYGSGKPLTDEQMIQVISYVFSKKGSQPANPKPLDAEREKACGAR